MSQAIWRPPRRDGPRTTSRRRCSSRRAAWRTRSGSNAGPAAGGTVAIRSSRCAPSEDGSSCAAAELGVHEPQCVLAVRQPRRGLEHLDEPEAPGRRRRPAPRRAPRANGTSRMPRSSRATTVGVGSCTRASSASRLTAAAASGYISTAAQSMTSQYAFASRPSSSQSRMRAGSPDCSCARSRCEQRGARLRLRGPALVGRGDLVGGHGDERTRRPAARRRA